MSILLCPCLCLCLFACLPLCVLQTSRLVCPGRPCVCPSHNLIVIVFQVGDRLLSIDGVDVNNLSHALQLLRSREADAVVKLLLSRQLTDDDGRQRQRVSRLSLSLYWREREALLFRSVFLRMSISSKRWLFRPTIRCSRKPCAFQGSMCG